MDSAAPQPFTTFMSFTEWARSAGRVPGQRTIELARRPASERVAEELSLDVGAPVVEVLRLRLLDGAPAMLERASFTWDVGRVLFDANLDAGSIYEHLGRCGTHFAHARHTIDAIGADELDASQLAVAPGAPLLRERRLSFTPDGAAAESADDRYLPGLTTFLIENSATHRAPLVRSLAAH
jgi:GntR family transcriptional regulator